MSDKDPQEMAKDLFTTDRDEILREQLPRMEEWFDVTGDTITFQLDLEGLSKGEKYLAYLLGAYAADVAGERQNRYVENSEADDRFGWNSGRSSTQYASKFTEMLDAKDNGKAIADHSLEAVIDKIADKVNN